MAVEDETRRVPRDESPVTGHLIALVTQTGWLRPPQSRTTDGGLGEWFDKGISAPTSADHRVRR
jgi:hypothetical protein